MISFSCWEIHSFAPLFHSFRDPPPPVPNFCIKAWVQGGHSQGRGQDFETGGANGGLRHLVGGLRGGMNSVVLKTTTVEGLHDRGGGGVQINNSLS